MKNSCIQFRKNSPFIQIQADYMAITGENECQSALLAYFQHWHEWKLNANTKAYVFARNSNYIKNDGTEFEGVLQWHKGWELVSGLLNMYTEKTIRKALVELEARGFIVVTRNPDDKNDQTKFYHFVAERVQAEIDQLPPVPEGKITDRKKANGKFTEGRTVNLPKGEGKITDLTYTTNKENNTKNTIVETSSTPSFDKQELKVAMEKELAILRTKKVEDPKDEIETVAKRLGISVLDLCEHFGDLNEFIETLNAEKKEGYISPELSGILSGEWNDKFNNIRFQLAGLRALQKGAEGHPIMEPPIAEKIQRLEMELAELTATSYGEIQNQIAEASKKVLEKTNDTEAVETPQNSEPIQSINFQNKTAPDATESTPVISNATGSERKNGVFEETTQPTALKPPKLQGSEKVTRDRAKRQKPEPEPPTLHKRCEYWFTKEFYPEKYQVSYPYSGKDGAALKKILEYLRKEYEKDTENQAFSRFQTILKKTTHWLVIERKHSLSVVSSNIHEIIIELKTPKTTPKNEQALPKDPTAHLFRAG